MNIEQIIKTAMDDMTRSERQVATCFLENPNAFAFSTLDAVAQLVDTSTTSVLRFCRKIGFQGFKDFQQSIRSQLRYQPQLPDKFQRTMDRGDAMLRQAVGQGIQCISDTFRSISEQELERAVTLLCNAKKVFTFGMRESFALAHYAYTRLLSVRQRVCLLQAGMNEQIETLLDVETTDVCLVFLFHRYTRQSIRILELLKERNVPVILVTNEPCDLLEVLAQVLLPCQVDCGGIKNSAVAPIVLSDYFCGAVAAELGEESLAHMRACEELFRSGGTL